MENSRQDQIRAYLFERGETPVQKLAIAMGASLATIRRDLHALETLGHIERPHGAARIKASAQRETAFALRETTYLAQKRAIANAAFDKIVPDSMIFLDAGTSVLQLARRIMLAKMPLTVVTNSLVVAKEMAETPQVTLVMLGGGLRPENMSTTGPAAVAMLESMWFDQLFLGASAISDDGFLSSFNPDEAQLNQHMATRATAVSILADHSKFGQRAGYNVLQLCEKHCLITDRTPAGRFADYAAESRLSVLLPPKKAPRKEKP